MLWYPFIVLNGKAVERGLPVSNYWGEPHSLQFLRGRAGTKPGQIYRKPELNMSKLIDAM